MMLKLTGNRKKIRLNKHTITIIESPPLKNIMNLKDGEEKLRKILDEAQ